jgi:hypothetical protein
VEENGRAKADRYGIELHAGNHTHTVGGTIESIDKKIESAFRLMSEYKQ